MAAVRLLRRVLDHKLRRRPNLAICCQIHCQISARLQSTQTPSSALFISNAVAQHTSPFQVDLDLDKRLTLDLDLLNDNLRHRGNTTDLQRLVDDFRLLKQLESRKTTLEKERESVAGMMKELVKAQVKSDGVKRSKEVLMSRGKEVRETLKALMPQYLELEERVMLTALRLPNHLHADTPLGETPHVVKETSAENGCGSSCRTSHVKLGRKHGLIKFSNVGPTAYYLLGELALLEQAVQSYVSQTLRDRGFVQLACPEMFRTAVVEASGTDIHSAEEVYTLSYHPKDEKPHPKIANSYHLEGVSPSSFSAFLAKTLTDSSFLPLRYFSIGRNYSPKGINYQTGLYRATQSIQARAFMGCSEMGDCDEAKGQLENIAMEMCSEMQLPVRLVRLPASELQLCEAYRSEVQMWSEPFQQYIQLGNVSVLGDFISRRLNIHTRDQSGSPTPIVMVHGCMLNVTRVLAALLENRFDEATSRVAAPDKLQAHLHGFM